MHPAMDSSELLLSYAEGASSTLLSKIYHLRELLLVASLALLIWDAIINISDEVIPSNVALSYNFVDMAFHRSNLSGGRSRKRHRLENIEIDDSMHRQRNTCWTKWMYIYLRYIPLIETGYSSLFQYSEIHAHETVLLPA